MKGNMKEDLKIRIENDFVYHGTLPDDVGKYKQLREKAKELAHIIADLVPGGREQSTALTRLEEAVMHANAGIARRGPVNPN